MRTLLASISFMLMTSLAFGQLFINEIDYDQPGTDAGEFIEIAGPAGTYTNVSLDHYNGSGGALLWSLDLPEFTLADEASGYGFYVVGVAAVPNVDITIPGSLQNSNEGVELKVNGSIVDAVAYEGDMIDSEGNPMESILGDFAGIDSSANRLGADGSPWEYDAYSPGAINTNQTFDPTVNYPPNANAGPDQSVESGATVTLDGTASADADGTIVSYLWEQTSGSTVTLTDAATASASFVVPTVTETSSWGFSLTVTDDEDESDSDEVLVTVSISAAMTIAEARTQPEGTLVTITGLVNSGNLSGSGSDYTIQDATAGINMYLAGVPVALGLGDEVTVTGITEDYSGKYEVKPATASDIVVNTTGNVLPEAQVISASELASNGEMYESELIRINGLSNAGTGQAWPASGSDANLDVTDGSGSTVMRIDKETEIDGTPEPIWPMDVVGIVSEFNGTFQIMPRMLTDFLSDIVSPSFANESHSPVWATAANTIEVSIEIIPGDETQTISSAVIMYGTDGTMLNESAMWLDNGNTWAGDIPPQAANSFLEFEIIATTGDGGTFDSYTYSQTIASDVLTDISSIHANPIDGDVFTIEGVVTIGSGVIQTGLTKAYIQDGSGRGLQLFSFEEITVNRGDMIKAVGVIELYNGNTLELKDFSYQLISTGNALPAPVVLDVSEANETNWDGTWIKVTGMITETFVAGVGQNFLIGDAAETCVVRIWNSTGIDVAGLTVGTEWSFLGVESQFSDAFQMVVAYEEDIISTSDIVQLDTKPERFALNPAYPNPFNPSTTLSWTLQEASELSLSVFDVQGREVSRLAQGHSPAGHFSMNWVATGLSSGVYFVRLDSPTQSAIQKVMLLK